MEFENKVRFQVAIVIDMEVFDKLTPEQTEAILNGIAKVLNAEKVESSSVSEGESNAVY